MNELLRHLEVWKDSKAKIFRTENYEASVSEVFGNSKQSRCIDIETGKLLARATLWETSELELEGLEKIPERTAIQKSVITKEIWRLDDELNWWLSEIATY